VSKTASITKYRAFLSRIAKLNNTTPEKVEQYLRALSSGRGVIYHLNLGV